MKLDEQRRREGVGQARIGVAGLHLEFVQQLDPCHRYARLDRHDDGVAGSLQGREGADAAGDRLGNALQAQGDRRQHAERPLRADEEPRQIVAGRGLAGAMSRAHLLAARRDGGEGDDVVAHGAVAHGIGARGACRGHPADRRVRAGIDREEEAGIAQIHVQVLARDPRLHGAVEILGIDLDHPVHAARIERDAAVGRVDMAFERSADAERDDRRAVLGADAHDLPDLGAGFRIDDRIRRLRRDVARRMRVLLAQCLSRLQAFAESLLQDFDGSPDALIVANPRPQVRKRHVQLPWMLFRLSRVNAPSRRQLSTRRAGGGRTRTRCRPCPGFIHSGCG